MKSSKLLHYPLMAIIAICVSSICSAQRHIIFNDSIRLEAYSTVRGDTLFIACDSAYMMNKKTYKMFRDNYDRVLSKDLTAKKLIIEYEKLIALQDTMLKRKESYYQGLKANFDALSSTAVTFADKTDVNVRAINSSLETVTGQLNNIKSLLDDSLAKLKKESKQKLKIAIGGFTVGVGVATIVFLIAK